jgi:hypothetical protein
MRSMADASDQKAAVPRSVAPQSAKPLSPAAQRALAEAAERRAAREHAQAVRANEHGGRGGLDPVRYGDWEVNGVASDF